MKKNAVSFLLILAFIGVLGYVWINFNSEANYTQKPTNETAEVFHDSISGWGYRIKRDTTIVIEQQYIPGAQGTKGFSTESEALKTAQLVLDKIKRNQFPPTITLSELDSLGINF